MKDLLNYYYFILPDTIHMIKNNYYFEYKSHFFGFYVYNGNIEELNSIFSLNNYMIFNNYKINRIILNKESSIITRKDNKNYILIELIINSQDKINLKNIIEFNKQKVFINLLNRTNYIGLTENAISYLKYFNLSNNNIGICHKRINICDNLCDFYNPLNLIIDYKVRDLSEYYKSLFWNKSIDVKNIIDSIKLIKMNNIDYIYFYIRMLYPSFYFDMFDNILNDKSRELDILKITKLQEEYEYLLYEIYKVIKSHVNIVGIEWINKKFAN